MKKIGTLLVGIATLVLLSACQPSSEKTSISSDLLETAQTDPVQFGSDILRLEQRLADNQEQQTRWPSGTANAVLITQQIEIDQKKIQQMMQILALLENSQGPI